MNNLHDIQNQIICKLQLAEKLRFSELNTEKLSNDHFTFHINELVKKGLISKRDDGFYELTAEGKSFSSLLDSETKKIEKQAKISILVVCTRDTKGKMEYLVHQRLKHPFFGFYGFTAGKIFKGETAYETAERELLEETGLTATLKLVGIQHKMDYSETNELLEDKFFFIFKGEDAKGTLIPEFEGGKNIWMSNTEIEKLPDRFDGFDEVLKMIQNENIQFVESKYSVKGF